MIKKITVFILLLLAIFGFRISVFAQDKKISQLTALPSVNGSELIPVAKSGSNFYMTSQQMANYALASSWLTAGNTLTGNGILGSLNSYSVSIQTNGSELIGLTTNGHIIYRAPIYDNSNILSANLTTRVLADNTAVNSIDWQNRNLFDFGGNVTGNFDVKTLYNDWVAVGSGNTSATYPLKIQNSSNTDIFTFRADGYFNFPIKGEVGQSISFGGTYPSNGLITTNGGASFGMYAGSSKDLYLGSNFANDVILKGSNHYLGIGLTSPVRRLDVYGAIGLTDTLKQVMNGVTSYVMSTTDTTFFESAKPIKINNGMTATSSLSVRGSLKIVNGSQASGRVLTSDASGVATWSTVPTPTMSTLSNGYGITSLSYSGASTATVTADSTVLASKPYVTAKLGGYAPLVNASMTTPTLGVASATSLKITGQGGAGYISLTTQTTTPSAPSAGTVLFSNSNSKLSWRGSGNTYMKSFDASNNSADHVYSLPNRDLKVDSLTTSTSTAINGIIVGNGANLTSYSTTGSGTVAVLATGASLTSPTITTGVLGSSTATTQSFGDNSTKVATTAYVDSKIITTYIIGNATTTSTVAATISGGTSGSFTFTGVANAVYIIDIHIHSQCSGSGGTKYQVTVPGSSTLDLEIFGMTSSTTAFNRQTITTSATLSSAFNTVASDGYIDIKGKVTMDGSGGTVSIGYASATSGQTSTVVAAGSYFKVNREQ